MQCRHSREGAPQRHASDHEALTEAVEQRIGGSATNSFTHHPRVQFDDLPFERAVEAQRGQRDSRRGGIFVHRDSLKNDLTLTLPLLCKHYRYSTERIGPGVRHSTHYNLLTLAETYIGITEDRVR